jgi:hypothetical protein
MAWRGLFPRSTIVVAMENLLKKQLAQIKARAIRLRLRGEAREGGEETGREIVEEVIRTGAVTRGAEKRPRAPWRRRWWRGREESEPPIEDVLARFKEGEPRALESLVPGEVRAAGRSDFYLVRPVGREIDPDAPEEAARFARLRRWPDDVARAVAGARRPGARRGGDAAHEPDPARVVFLDIETGGLSASTYLFLCGLMFLEDGAFVVEQAFARDYPEETGVLAHVRETLARFDTVVTYNGASFDLPFLRTRMAVHRIDDIGSIGSVDLLQSARRVFHDILPNRRLVTVERHLRRVDRSGDIPGRHIPDAWHDYVRTRDGRAMQNVLYHNRMDIFTMAVILNRFADRSLLDEDPAARKRFDPDARGDRIGAPDWPDAPF